MPRTLEVSDDDLDAVVADMAEQAGTTGQI